MDGLLHTLLEQIQNQTWLDWTITVTALSYVFLAAKENSWCWVWGIVSCSLWAYADFYRYNLWVDGILQIFYVGMGFWGLYSWRLGNSEKYLPITTIPLKNHLFFLFAGAVLTCVLGYVFDRYTPTAMPYPDSFVTAFSILATFFTVRKILESWLYWIVVDALAVFLFAAREAVLVAFVMAVYTVIAVFGFLSWRRKWKEEI